MAAMSDTDRWRTFVEAVEADLRLSQLDDAIRTSARKIADLAGQLQEAKLRQAADVCCVNSRALLLALERVRADLGQEACQAAQINYQFATNPGAWMGLADFDALFIEAIRRHPRATAPLELAAPLAEEHYGDIGQKILLAMGALVSAFPALTNAMVHQAYTKACQLLGGFNRTSQMRVLVAKDNLIVLAISPLSGIDFLGNDRWSKPGGFMLKALADLPLPLHAKNIEAKLLVMPGSLQNYLRFLNDWHQLTRKKVGLPLPDPAANDRQFLVGHEIYAELGVLVWSQPRSSAWKKSELFGWEKLSQDRELTGKEILAWRITNPFVWTSPGCQFPFLPEYVVPIDEEGGERRHDLILRISWQVETSVRENLRAAGQTILDLFKRSRVDRSSGEVAIEASTAESIQSIQALETQRNRDRHLIGQLEPKLEAEFHQLRQLLGRLLPDELTGYHQEYLRRTNWLTDKLWQFIPWVSQRHSRLARRISPVLAETMAHLSQLAFLWAERWPEDQAADNWTAARATAQTQIARILVLGDLIGLHQSAPLDLRLPIGEYTRLFVAKALAILEVFYEHGRAHVPREQAASQVLDMARNQILDRFLAAEICDFLTQTDRSLSERGCLAELQKLVAP